MSPERDHLHDCNSNAQTLHNSVKRVVEQGADVQEQVKQITLHHIRSGQLDTASLQDLARAVVNGALAGARQAIRPAAANTEITRQHLQEAVTGLDMALAKIAEASKLAIQEATGNAQRFSREELLKTQEDMQALENLFVETLQESARGLKDVGSQILTDMATHARNSGSAVGQQMQDTLNVIGRNLLESGNLHVQTGWRLAQATSDLLYQISAGVIRGIADQVETKPISHKDK